MFFVPTIQQHNTHNLYMKIINTSILLTVTLVTVVVLSYLFGTALGDNEWDIIYTLSLILGGSIAYTFIVGELTNNNSQVDKLWSILPIIYVWVIAYYSNFNERLVIMSILVTIWGIRLTTNFALKGAYQWKFWTGEEDYRWSILREKPEFQPRWKWTLFNLFFICGYQNILILLFTLPALVAYQYLSVPMGYMDYVAAALMLFFIAYEALADVQQWNFQSKKWELLRNNQSLTEPYSKGYLDKGLWAYCRHPNYFAEQSIWVSFYIFSAAASGQPINWSIAGCLLLIMLFQGSANFAEEISEGKYPTYSTYKKNVPTFIPLFKKSIQ